MIVLFIKRPNFIKGFRQGIDFMCLILPNDIVGLATKFVLRHLAY